MIVLVFIYVRKLNLLRAHCSDESNTTAVSPRSIVTWKPFSVSELGLLAAFKNHRSGVAAQREARIQTNDKHI